MLSFFYLSNYLAVQFFWLALQKEALTTFDLRVSVAYEQPCLLSTLEMSPNKLNRQWKKGLPQFFRTSSKI